MKADAIPVAFDVNIRDHPLDEPHPQLIDLAFRTAPLDCEP